MRINKKNNRKGFTLFELIIVVILFSIVSSFVLVKFNILSPEKQQLTLENIKSHLLTYDFEDSISLKCTDEKECFLYLDDEIQEEKVKLTILDNIEVYKYDDTLTQVFFKDIEPEELQTYGVLFELTIDKDKKHKDMIVLNGDSFYIFNSIYKSPILLSSSSDINDFFYNLKEEVKNSAF